MSPREIDDYVRATVAAGGDLYTLHADALVTGIESIAAILHPDAVRAPPPGSVARVA
jgi:hypothetical protein